MGGKIWLIIIIIVGLGLGLYLYSSGAFVKGVSGFNSLFPVPAGSGSRPAGTATSAAPSSWDSFLQLLVPSGKGPVGPSIPPSEQQTIIAAPSGGTGTSPSNAVNPADIPAGFTAAQISPYYQEVRFGTIFSGTYASYGTITLDDDDYNSSTSTIDVTGWQIRATHGDEYVPQAVNLYDPTGFAPATDILLKTGDTVYIYSSSAPFNLRLNECIGYAAHVATFNPPLPESCPYIDQSQLQSFTGQCQNYIESLGQCQQPDFSSPQIPQGDYACMDYLENNFTYRSCFDAHSEDANFLSDQVWVWTGSNPVNPYHDTVELLDKNGLLVDLYTY